jgi:hypothetical protein
MEARPVTARTPACLALALLCTGGVAHGQSLGQIAEQEMTRRQRVAGGKQYTNDDLKPESTPAVPLPAAAPEPATAAAPAPVAPAQDVPAAATDKSEKPLVKEHRDEAYWRGRVRELRAQIEKLRGEIKAMETRTEALEAEAAGVNELNVTQTALNRLRTNLQSFTQELDAFQARGRRANVPMDWLQ